MHWEVLEWVQLELGSGYNQNPVMSDKISKNKENPYNCMV